MGRQHQGMDRPGVRQVPEASGEQGKIEETGCEIICDAPTALDCGLHALSCLSGYKASFMIGAGIVCPIFLITTSFL